MRKVTIGEQTLTLNACPYTLVVYERAFGPGKHINDDINEFLNAKIGTLIALPLESMLRLLYVYAHSDKDAARPDFDDWVEALPMEALDQYAISAAGGWGAALIDETVSTFFPSLAHKDVGATTDGEDTESAA